MRKTFRAGRVVRHSPAGSNALKHCRAKVEDMRVGLEPSRDAQRRRKAGGKILAARTLSWIAT